MFDALSDAALVALFGFLGGVVLGLAARIGRFCTLGAVEDYLYQGCDIRLRMWFLAIGIAGMASFALVSIGALDLPRTIYHLLPFSPVASVAGGLLFGYGMSLAGNCGFGALARFGGGDLRSFVIVLVMGVSAYMMQSGPLAGLRIRLISASSLPVETKDYATYLAAFSGLSIVAAGLLLSTTITLAALAGRNMLSRPGPAIWGALVGLAIASGWAGTYWVTAERFSAAPALSHTFTAPLGETLIFIMTSSGGGLSFGVGSVFGVLTGALCGSIIKGQFRWEACEDPRELKRQIVGAVCMGFGAVLALGCTIGQGISAFSVMALSAPITFAAIFAGAALGLKHLITGFPSLTTGR